MLSDLIERLRDKKRLRAAHGLTGWVLAEEALLAQAADEIERLTAALQHEADCVEAAKAEIERLTAERDELRRQLAEAELDARRYRWLRPRFFAADFAYSDPPVCAIVFRWPESAKISANLDREIDAAMGASNE